MPGEAANMHLVNDGSRRRMPQRCVTFPIVGGGIHHHALHCGCTVVGVRGGIIAPVAIRNRHAATIGIEQKLGGIEPHAPRRIVRPLDAIAVDLAGRHPWDESVPVVVRAIVGGIDADNTRRTGIVDMIKQQQLHPGGVTRVDREIHATAGQYCPEWRAAAFPDSRSWVQALQPLCISKCGGHVVSPRSGSG